MDQLMIVGGGFAGVWAAIAAARLRDRRPDKGLQITLVSRGPWHTIRPRLYEDDLADVRIPLDDVLGPIDVQRVDGDVTRIDTPSRSMTVETARGEVRLRYDRVVLAAGSRLQRPAIPGIERAHAVDTYEEASALKQHLEALPTAIGVPPGARYRAVVVGAGFTGIEVATSLAAQLRRAATLAGDGSTSSVVLVERAPVVAQDLGDAAREHVEHALRQLGIRACVGAQVDEVRTDGVVLSNGEFIPAATTVWTGGFRANELTNQLAVERDAMGRLHVDETLHVAGVNGVFAAGDVAHAMADAFHAAPMSCQCGIPMGELAGYNAAAELLDLPLRPYSHRHYVTCLDLGDAGALFMEGWERHVRLTGFWANILKQAINTRLIYPPRPGHASRPDRDSLAA